MKPYRLILPLALALAALAAGGAAMPAASADGTCTERTNVYLYTNDAQALAGQLAANVASCADYWISVTPYTATTSPNYGKPKGPPALPVIHQQGPQFHGLAEIRLPAWCSSPSVTANGWYATGQMLHDWMLVEGYDPSRDTWAINEVGWPTPDPCDTAVFADMPGARRDFQDFVHGLYDGYPGETPMRGFVFVGSPIQMTPDLTSYEEGLAQWYADTPFWQDMNRYVAVWAQETYADARAWGVDGSSLADRATALNAYFLHGQKLAAEGGEATAAARDFFAHAYTPLANASYKQPIPTPPVVAYGYTDIGYPSLISNFISAQTYALRSSMGDRFGFAVWPNNLGTASDVRLGVEAQVGRAIRDSQDDHLGACTAPGESCDGSVTGGVFPETWPDFATPPTITPHVEGQLSPNGWYTGDVTVTWDVAEAQTPDSLVTSGCDPVTITSDTLGTTLTCTATSSGGWNQLTETIRRDATPPVITLPTSPIVDATAPAGATVSFSVAATDAFDPSPVVVCLPPSGAVFVIGTTTVSCTATDGSGNRAAGSFTVTVRGAAEQLSDLAAAVKGVGPGESLADTVAVARWFLAHGQPKLTCLTLTAFQLEVWAQSGKKIPAAQASTLIADATRIKTVLGCTK